MKYETWQTNTDHKGIVQIDFQEQNIFKNILMCLLMFMIMIQ